MYKDEVIILSFSLFNTAEPCPNISTILNGRIQCTGPQVTDENCTFICDPGYNLTGSSLRICQSDHTWSGEAAFCPPLHCVEFIAPENASIIAQCNTEYTSSCRVTCNEGFDIEDDPNALEWIQTCGVTTEGSVEWMGAKKCIGTYHTFVAHYINKVL